MAEFSADELRQMEEGLTKVGHAFIAYDLDVTKRYQEKTAFAAGNVSPQLTPMEWLPKNHQTTPSLAPLFLTSATNQVTILL
jgi:hypothetical protein